ncbi:hypothetical protein PAMP_021596 [Pampus punctatissimus]
MKNHRVVLPLRNQQQQRVQGLGSLKLVSNTADVYPKTKAEKLHPKQYFSCQRYLLVHSGIVSQTERGVAEEETDHPNWTEAIQVKVGSEMPPNH